MTALTLGALKTPEDRQRAAVALKTAATERKWLFDEHNGDRLYYLSDPDEHGNSFRIYEDGEKRTNVAQPPQGSAGPAGAAQVDDDLFRLWPMGKLLDADREFRWQARGMLVDPTYGFLGGERKTLKTYVSTFIGVGLATGVPIFDHFKVDDPGAVVAYVGEGGRIPYTRRLERVAAAMDVNPREMPFFPSFDVAPISSPIFVDSLKRDLEQLDPVLVMVDPLYAFHGTKTNASDLYEEGALLTTVSGPCIEAYTSCLVVSHFNKTGTGRGLDRITQVGAQEWSDTWLLLSHRAPPDVANGRFQLILEVASRQWGGSTWDLDIDLGRFDVELGEFDGDITWALRRHRDPMVDSLEAKVLGLIAAHPYQLTREDLAKGMGGNLSNARAFLADLESKGAIGVRQVSRERSDGRLYKVWAFHLNHASSDVGRCETTEEEECA